MPGEGKVVSSPQWLPPRTLTIFGKKLFQGLSPPARRCSVGTEPRVGASTIWMPTHHSHPCGSWPPLPAPSPGTPQSAIAWSPAQGDSIYR